MQFLILGPLEVRDQRGPVPLGGTKPRAVVAVLLLNANRPVSADRLAHALWGEEASARAVKTVQVHVSRLRKALGDADTIETSAAGYCLRVRPGELDAERFEQLLEEARRALKVGDAEQAAAVVRSALELWRGPPLADLVGEAFLRTDIARLEDLRLTAIELRVEADVARGREAELIGELRQLVDAHPTREQFAGHLMLALYRGGRQADALESYREARRRLIAASGVEPGPELRALQAAILRQDRSLLGAGVAELPRELVLAAATALEGRDFELAWLRERWIRARAGAGALITLGGETGIGKSRLAAELATEAHARGATVLYADAGGPPAATLGVLARARTTPGPTVLVVDDADRAPAEVREELATFGRDLSQVPVLALVLDTAGNGGLDGEGLLLTPLDIGAANAIVTRYAPDDAGDDPPAEWLLGASRGVPGLIHELADQWARQEAARRAAHRIEAGAERTAAGRADLRAMERELAADVVVLAAARGSAPAEAGPGALVCPFKGLASFQVADAPYFFGRERLVAELVARLVGAPLLGIVGPSGSGKSSVLRAGLLPALAAGVLPGSERCPQALIRPGAHPMLELQTALARASQGPVVLAVDQFEELFTICDDEQERAAFVAELARLAHESEGQGAIALAMRADFYGRCAEYPDLSRLLAANHVLVGAMREEELRRAVECPAQRAGLIVEPDLVDALVTDVRGEPGALPLLSTALLELWQGLAGRRRLRHAAYLESGGVRGAVARLGERAYMGLDKTQQAVARRVLLRLAPIDEEGGVERRRVARADLGGEDANQVVALLADSRLVTVHASSVELTHEALLREWPRLRGWIQESQDIRRVQRSLGAEARKWVRLGRDEDALLRGALLAEVQESIDPDTLDVEIEREFLLASLERRRSERLARRHRWEVIVGALTVGLVAIGVVALIAMNQRDTAERERNVALSRGIATRSSQALATDPELALRLALWAYESAPTVQSAAALRQATHAIPQIAELDADPVTANTAVYSPDGRWIVTGGEEGIARLWDAAKRERVELVNPNLGELLAARYSGDGDRIALGFERGVVIADGALHDDRAVLDLDVDDPLVTRVAISRNGERVAVAFEDGTARVIALDDTAPDIALGTPSGPINGIDINEAGRVATGGRAGVVKVWNPDGTARTLQAEGFPVRDVRFSPDGKLVLAVSDDGQARLWNAETRKSVGTRHVAPRYLTAAAFSRDGTRFATASWDGAVRVFSTSGMSQLLVLQGQLARVYDVSFGRSINQLVSAGDDGSARIWNASGIQAFGGPAITDNIDFSPSGKWIVSAEDGTLRVRDPETARLHRTQPGPMGYTQARFSPVKDELVILRGDSSSIFLWSLTDRGERLVRRLPSRTEVHSTRFDPTGTRIIYSTTGGPVVIHDLRSGRDVELRGAPKEVLDVGISPDSKQAAGAAAGGEVLVWRLDQPQRPVRRMTGHRGDINTIGYGPDGRIVTAGADRTVRVWDPRTGKQTVLRGHVDEVNTAIFTPDSERVLSASADGSVRIWDADGGDALVVLQTGETPLYDVVVRRDGLIASLDGNQIVHVFRCAVCGPISDVLALARSRHLEPLTPEERARFVADIG